MMASQGETETLAERQENEFQVLQAIYVDDVVDLRENDAWKVPRPPELKIILRPQASMTTTEVYSSVVLYVKCPVTYPEVVPEIRLEDPKGISNQYVQLLCKEVETLARSLLGEVMILELAQHIQKFLHAHDKPPSKSFYDEMMSNKKRQEEQTELKRQQMLARVKENEEKQHRRIEEEIQRRQEALREETRRRRLEAKQVFDNAYMGTEGAGDRTSMSEPSSGGSDAILMTPIPKDTEQRRRHSLTPERQTVIAESGSYPKNDRRRRTTSTPKRGDSESEGENKCNNHTGVIELSFDTKRERKVHRGRCLGHSSRGCTQYAGMDTATGELLVVTEWTLQWRKAKRKLDLDEQKEDQKLAAGYIKQIGGIESELMSLMRLHHENLVHFVAFRHTQDNGSITIHVLSEFIAGGSLDEVLHSRLPLPVDQLRYYTIQLVDVLHYLHGKTVVHKNLRLSSILLDPGGKIRLADYSIDHRLAELYSSVDATRPGVHFADERPIVPGRGGKKGDIYMMGILLLSLVERNVITEKFPDVPTSLPSDLQDFLNRCLLRDERSRWSAVQLQEHGFVKTAILKSPCELKTDKDDQPRKKKGLDDDEDGDEDGTAAMIPFIPSSESGQSRLKNEFEILRWLGKGGFGDVIKVRNKLDGRFYAIKRIPLNPRSKHFTRKITREVKLLSRLNHENVVRYYNSWIEVSEEPVPSDSSTIETDTPITSPGAPPAKQPAAPQANPEPSNRQKDLGKHRNSLGLCDSIEQNAPPAVSCSLDWSLSLSSSRHMAPDSNDDDDDEDEEEDDENDVFGLSFAASFFEPSDSQDDSIIFDHNDTNGDFTSQDMESSVAGPSGKEPKPAPQTHATTVEQAGSPPPRLQFLYIQMEFCEKSTLRDCIDCGLYQDRDRVWRLFREIVDGLAHIHQQGMIHRDLKPVNIFLDSDDQVKIGDFGLATTDIITQQQTGLLDLNITPSLNLDPRVSSSKSESLGDGNLTGKVGTALYVSPEMMNHSSARTHYNHKVDIYSLGVIFFEMCYRPLPTGMERVQVLTALRQPGIILPSDFDQENEMENQMAILQLLLNHDPSVRPTAEQLLASELLPPPQLQEAELTEVLRSTLSQPDTKAYRHMISAIFRQRVDPATDFTYDVDLHKLKSRFVPEPLLVQRSAIESLERIFEKHGALRLTTPLLLPKSPIYEASELCVSMMDYSGGLVSLPYDLRVPFARYVARNNVTSLKRYSIERVYRQKRFPHLHPRELVECAFDIVTPTTVGPLPDAELIHVASDIIKEFPPLQARNYYLRLNHTLLLRGVFLHCGVQEELFQEVCNILSDVRVERHQKLQVQTRLANLSLSDETILRLYRFIENEGPYGKVASFLRCITKTKSQAASYVKQSLHEIEALLNQADLLGCKMQSVVAIGLVYNMHYYEGIVFQVAANIRRKNRTTMEVLAVGGRYDSLIAKFSKHKSAFGNQGTLPSASGISISFERLIAARQDQEWQSRGVVDVLVASLGHKPLTRERLQVAGSLWGVGLRTHVVYDSRQSLEEIHDLAKILGVSQVVILKDLDGGHAKVRSMEKDKVIEKKVQMSELTNYLLQKVSAVKGEIPETSAPVGSKGCGPSGLASAEIGNTLSSQVGGGVSGGSGGSGGSGSMTANLTLILPDKVKMAANTKRRFEAQIYNNISTVVSTISNKVRIEVLGLDFGAVVLKTIAAHLEVGHGEGEFENSISSIMEKLARRDDKKYLNKIFEEIHNLIFRNNRSQVIILYGMKDDSYRVIM